MKTLLKDRITQVVIVFSLTLYATAGYSQEAYFLDHQDDSRNKKGVSDQHHSDGGYHTSESGYDPHRYKDEPEEVHEPIERRQSVRPKKQPAKKNTPPVSKPQQQNTEDAEPVLSFNFLYYIIQKFKFSDMIE